MESETSSAAGLDGFCIFHLPPLDAHFNPVLSLVTLFHR